MANKDDRVKDNPTGKWYVDSQCIDCDLCRTTCPSSFKQNPDEGYSYVYKQPETEEESKLATQAMEECPVEAIGNDGA